MDEKPSILIVDDDENTCRTLSFIFEKKGYETETAGMGREAIEKAKGRFFNLALLGIRLPDIEGVEFLAPLKEMHPDMEVIMITGYASLETAVRALGNGASAYITKPLNMDELLAAARKALEKQRLVVENRKLYKKAQQELSERKRAEQRLREYDARYRHLLDHMPDGVALIRNERIIRVNPPMAQMFGFPSPEEMKGVCIWDLAAPGSKEVMMQGSTSIAIEEQGENRFEFQALRRDGQAFPAEVTLTVDRSESEPFVLSIIRDVTERKSLENQRKLLSNRIMTAQERERTLIARELHDELAQALTGIKMDMAWIKGHMKGLDEDVSQRFVALGELIDSTIESVQEMATSLRPSVLDRLGLAAAIEWYAGEFERRTGIECVIESEDSDFKVSKKTAINAYRIYQEALTNVARHARASSVDVRIAKEGKYLVICISDNGRGIPSEKLSGPMSLGIAGMRERAKLVKGRLDIHSQRGRRTKVTAYLPAVLHSKWPH